MFSFLSLLRCFILRNQGRTKRRILLFEVKQGFLFVDVQRIESKRNVLFAFVFLFIQNEINRILSFSLKDLDNFRSCSSNKNIEGEN